MHNRHLTLDEQQRALTQHLRDPQSFPPPSWMDAKRVRIYAELVSASLITLLSGTFPVLVSILGASTWQMLVKGFLREHRSHTPKFSEIAEQFVQYLAYRNPSQTLARSAPPYMTELAHYEWIEMALMNKPAQPLTKNEDRFAADALLRISPLAWRLAYQWPVHRISPLYLPDEPLAQPTLLLVQRGQNDRVQFSELSPLAWRLLERIEQSPLQTAQAHLEHLAEEANATDKAFFLADGWKLLDQMRFQCVLSTVNLPDKSVYLSYEEI